MDGIKQYYHHVDGVKINELKNWRIHNVTTSDRTTLGGTLNAANKGLLVYDSDLNEFFVWSGSAWSAVSSTIAGAMTFKAAVAFNATEPVSPATGDFYIFTTSGTNTWEGSTVVEAGDSAVWNGTSWNFIQGNVIDATESVKGVVQLASTAEVVTGTNTTKAVTAAGVTAKLSDYKSAKVYFIGNAALTANTALTVAHNLGLQNRNAFTINVMDSTHSGISVDVDSVDQNNLTVRSSVGLTGVSITVIGF
jgi:hypothetical protein